MSNRDKIPITASTIYRGNVAGSFESVDAVADATSGPGSTCGSFPGSFATTVTLVGGAETAVSRGNCYRYQYVVADKVGNVTIYSSASVAKF